MSGKAPRVDLIPQDGSPRIAGGWVSGVVPHLPAAITDPRPQIAGLSMDRPRIMGILNVTPDSFSDGGQHNRFEAALARAQAMVAEGADILDIGGESTRPGAAPVPEDEEISRVVPVIAALRAAGLRTPISVDTRSSAVAFEALNAGAEIVNDVSGFAHDPQMKRVVAEAGCFACLMHMRGTPETMQSRADYGDVLAEVTAELSGRIAAAEAAGVDRSKLIADPGIGFAKGLEQNLTLLRHVGAFHGLGLPLLVGVSRKRFIGEIGQTPDATERMPGSVAAALACVAQGVQILRVHDVAATKQAVRLWGAITCDKEW